MGVEGEGVECQHNEDIPFFPSNLLFQLCTMKKSSLVLWPFSDVWICASLGVFSAHAPTRVQLKLFSPGEKTLIELDMVLCPQVHVSVPEALIRRKYWGERWNPWMYGV